MQPDQALEQVLSNREGKYARWAAKLLTDSIGRFPIGALVELNTGERGIVLDRPRAGAPANRPRVRLIAGRDGKPLPVGTVVDLGEQAASQRFIRRALDAARESVNVSHFFLD